MNEIFNNMVVTDIVSVFTAVSQKGKKILISSRKSYGLSFCTEGEIIYTQNGKQYIEDKHHAIILPQGKEYNLLGTQKGIFPVINFHCQNFLCDTLISIPIENPSEFMKDYEKLFSLSLFDGNRMKMLSIFYNILHKMTISPDFQVLLPAIKHIENNYHDPKLNNSELALQCHISEVYFRKLFSEQYKTTPRQFIIDIRINKAKQLLSEGILKISAISELCGFSNPYHFCRTFKKQVGVTPTEYMINNRLFKI